MDKAYDINYYLRAGFGIINIKCNEHTRIRKEIIPMIENDPKCEYEIKEWDLTVSNNPVDPITTLSQANNNTIMFVYNYHWFIDKPMSIQHILNALPLWASQDKHFVIVSSEVKIPAELDKSITSLEMNLPDDAAILQAIDHVVPEEKYMPKNKNKILSSSKGLTIKQMEDVFSLSLVRSGKIDPFIINQYKAEAFSKTGFIQIIEPKRTFDDLIGMDLYKSQVKETICHPKAKGVLGIGPPGCGKTSIAEAVVGETGKIGFSIDMGKLFSKYVGETGKNVDMVIDILSSVGPCFVLIDEFEKQFAGAGGGGDTDSGNTRRSLSKWLNFLQSRPEGVYICGTANSFNGIPPEYLRPGRWDTSPFYFDLPSAQTRLKILDYYCKKSNMNITKKDMNDINKVMNDFSGAEIEALVDIAAMRKKTLTEAKYYIKPIAITMGAEINALRDWAKTRCIYSEEETEEQMGRQLKI